MEAVFTIEGVAKEKSTSAASIPSMLVPDIKPM
jgi:hypothetical protein